MVGKVVNIPFFNISGSEYGYAALRNEKEENWQLQKALLFKTEQFYITHTVQIH